MAAILCKNADRNRIGKRSIFKIRGRVAQYMQGKTNLAEKSLREAVELIGRHSVDSDTSALQYLVSMESWLENWGIEQMVVD